MNSVCSQIPVTLLTKFFVMKQNVKSLSYMTILTKNQLNSELENRRMGVIIDFYRIVVSRQLSWKVDNMAAVSYRESTCAVCIREQRNGNSDASTDALLKSFCFSTLRSYIYRLVMIYLVKSSAYSNEIE